MHSIKLQKLKKCLLIPKNQLQSKKGMLLYLSFSSFTVLIDCYSANQTQTRSSTGVRSSTCTKGRSTKDTMYVLSPFKALYLIIVFFSPLLASSDNDVELMFVFFLCVKIWCILNLWFSWPVIPMIFPLRN